MLMMSKARQSCVYSCDVLQLMDPQNLAVPQKEVHHSS